MFLGQARGELISIHALRVEGDSAIVRSPIPDFPDFYPRPPGGGRLRLTQHAHGERTISIHALRVEGDVIVVKAPRVKPKFLSTPSGWRATAPFGNILTAAQDFYPRPPGGGRRVSVHVLRDHVEISIHALRVEGDCRVALYGWRCWIISIHALRVEGDIITNVTGNRRAISIHALRVEGDGDCAISNS